MGILRWQGWGGGIVGIPSLKGGLTKADLRVELHLEPTRAWIGFALFRALFSWVFYGIGASFFLEAKTLYTPPKNELVLGGNESGARWAIPFTLDIHRQNQ